MKRLYRGKNILMKHVCWSAYIWICACALGTLSIHANTDAPEGQKQECQAQKTEESFNTIPKNCQNKAVLNGFSVLSNAHYESLEINGTLNCNDVTVDDVLIVNGAMGGRKLTCHSLQSNGSFYVDAFQAVDVEHNGSFVGECIAITGTAKLHGNVRITHGKMNHIILATPHATLVQSTVDGNIHVKKQDNTTSFLGWEVKKSSPSILELRGNTIVKGDVIFEKPGEVQLWDNSKIEGKIIQNFKPAKQSKAEQQSISISKPVQK